MGKRGTKPQRKVKIKWSPKFAYAIGLLTTDGNLSSRRYNITLVSNDLAQIQCFKKCLGLSNIISKHHSGSSRKYGFHIQFGDKLFYNFLKSIGITPRKSLTIYKVLIPDKYFFDFLRGHFDGDGSFHSYWDPRWRSSFMFYTFFYSASKKHIYWLQKMIRAKLKINGYITKPITNSTYALRYAKQESMKLLRQLYYTAGLPLLKRKHLKLVKALATIGLYL